MNTSNHPDEQTRLRNQLGVLRAVMHTEAGKLADEDFDNDPAGIEAGCHTVLTLCDVIDEKCQELLRLRMQLRQGRAS